MKHVKLDKSAKHAHRMGAFGIEILYPGQTLGKDDSGIGAIGRIDHARIGAGTVVPMHPHSDDEILSYMRAGTMIHRDTVGHEEALTNTRMMMMNAGHSFQHQERMAEPVSMLQIFLRPHTRGLEPMVQFHAFDAVTSDESWRMLAGPKGAAPLEVRASAWVQDTRLAAGSARALPAAPVTGVTRLLYAFSGLVTVGDTVLAEGESLVLGDSPAEVSALETSDLVLFTTDTAAPVFKGGMFSGNKMSR